MTGSGEPFVLGKFDGSVRSIVFLRDGAFIAAGVAPDTIAVWEADTGARLADIRGTTLTNDRYMGPVRLETARGGKFLVAYWPSRGACELSTWEVSGTGVNKGSRTFRQLLIGRPDSLGLSDDGSILALLTTGTDWSLYLFDPRSTAAFPQPRPQRTGKKRHFNRISRTFLSANGGHCGFVYRSIVHVGRVSELRHEPETVLSGHRAGVYAAIFGPEPDQVITGGGDRTTRIWDTSSGAEIEQFDWGVGIVTTLALSPDGAAVAVGGENGLVLFDLD